MRHVLETVYALDAVEQIVSAADRYNLSAVDSVDLVRAQTGGQTLFALQRRTVAVEVQKIQIERTVVNEKRVVYALAGNEARYANNAAEPTIVQSVVNSAVAQQSQKILHIET